MPVEFLTDGQAAAYGKFVEEPTRPELERFFFLDDVDRDLIALRRTQHQGKGWEAVREDVLAGLSLDEDAEQHLRELIEVLDATWKQMAERLEEAGTDAKISIEVQPNGRAKLNVEKLHVRGEPKSLNWLRKRVEKMLPKIDLPDLLFEVHAWTGFLDAVVHLGDGRTRVKDLSTSVVALGRYSFTASVPRDGLRPLRDPDAVDLDDDDGEE